MDRSDFYNAIRPAFGGKLTGRQVQGIDALLNAAGNLPVAEVAHVLGEVRHETGGGMYPVKETVFPYSKDKNPSDATVIKRLDAAWAKGQLPWVKKPYWRGGHFGRGQLQNTHLENYKKASALTGVDLVAHPDRALELPISATIAMQGCAVGLFTGKKLSDYHRADGSFDHVNARAIVNGDKNKIEKNERKTIGQKVAAYAAQFDTALRIAGTEPALPPQAPTTRPTAPVSGFWATIIAAIVRLFKGH